MTDARFQVSLTERLKKKLGTVTATVGVLAGWRNEGAWTCVDCATSPEYFLPGLENVGFFFHLESQPESESDLLAACKTYLVDDFKAPENDCLVLFSYNNSSGDGPQNCLVSKLYSSYYCSLEAVELSEKDADISNVELFRARGEVPLIFEGSADSELQEENLQLAIDRLKTVLQSNMLMFLAKSSNVILKSSVNDDDSVKILCKDFLRDLRGGEPDKKKSKKVGEEKIPVNLQMALQTTGQVAIENNVNHSLVIHCQRREFLCVTVTLQVDVLVVVQRTSFMNDVYYQLTKAVSHQLEKFQKCLLAFAKGSKFPTPEVYYFHPFECDFPVTVIYPAELSDEELEKHRKSIHSSLLLPPDRPFLKKTNNYVFPDDVKFGGCLINPHVGLQPSGVQDGISAIVYGRYAYHHYMQDHINDDGWGCAYRSLQTIISWFKLQGYTDRNVPSHKEIQQALVDVGDKPASFVGSRKWIGSQEVSFCLNHLLGVTSKILCVNSGAELASKGRELLHHFQNHGTPVMIGGGVLAHTIIGVDFNTSTGDLKYLVLDPHYTGSEDIGTIQSKGWCGWKKLDFWDQNAFYNLCLPQRPLMI